MDGSRGRQLHLDGLRTSVEVVSGRRIRSLLSPVGKGGLRSANSYDSELHLVFEPVEKVFRVSAKAVRTSRMPKFPEQHSTAQAAAVQ